MFGKGLSGPSAGEGGGEIGYRAMSRQAADVESAAVS